MALPALADASFSDAAKRFDWAIIDPPNSDIRVGELIQPGLEDAGSVSAIDTTSRILDFSRLKIERVALDTPYVLRAGIDFDVRGPAAQCRPLVASADAIDVASMPIRDAKTASATHLFEYQTSYDSRDVRGDLTPPDLWNYVIVTTTVSPVVHVSGCRDDAIRSQVERQLSLLVLAYQAVAPYSGAQQDVGWNLGGIDFFYKILGAFGIGELANKATITLSSVTTNPIGQRVGWANTVTLGGHTAAVAADDEFKAWGRTPITKKRIGTGKYFFRVRRSDTSFETVTRELTLSDDGTSLTL